MSAFTNSRASESYPKSTVKPGLSYSPGMTTVATISFLDFALMSTTGRVLEAA